MNFSLLWNLLAVGTSGTAVYLMGECPIVSVLLAGFAGLIIGLTSRFDLIGVSD